MKNEISNTLWQKQGKFLIIGVIVLLGSVGGWQYLEHRTTLKVEEASKLYDSVLMAFQKKQFSKAEETGTKLIQEYKQGPYAQLAALILARIAFEQDNLEVTTQRLREAVQMGEKSPALHIARVRLSKVLAAQDKTQEGLDLLTQVNPPKEYLTLYEEAKGDLYLIQKDLEKARIAYKEAVKAAPEGVSIPWVQLKQGDLGGSNTKQEGGAS